MTEEHLRLGQKWDIDSSMIEAAVEDPTTEKLGKAHAVTPIKPIDRERKMVARLRARIEKVITKALKAVKKDVLDSLPDLGVAEKVEDSLAARIQKAIDDLNLTGFALVEDDVDEILAEIAKDGLAVAALQIGAPGDAITDAMESKAVAYAKERAAQLVGSLADSTREFLRSDIAQAMEEGWSNQKLASVLKENYAFSEGRAAMIARTETAYADVAGNMITYRESGLVSGKEWIEGTADTCEECMMNVTKGVIDLDDTFPSGDDAPPLHPNCTCDVLPVLGEEGT